MKNKYSIGFLTCCTIAIIAMTFAYQFSYQKAKERAENIRSEEQQLKTKQPAIETDSTTKKNECFYLMEVNGYIVVYLGDRTTAYEYTDIHYDDLPKSLRQEIRNGKYIKNTEELYGFLENYSS